MKRLGGKYVNSWGSVEMRAERACEAWPDIRWWCQKNGLI